MTATTAERRIFIEPNSLRGDFCGAITIRRIIHITHKVNRTHPHEGLQLSEFADRVSLCHQNGVAQQSFRRHRISETFVNRWFSGLAHELR